MKLFEKITLGAVIGTNLLPVLFVLLAGGTSLNGCSHGLEMNIDHGDVSLVDNRSSSDQRSWSWVGGDTTFVDNSTHITINPAGDFVIGDKVVHVGDVIHDHSTSTSYVWNGSFWIGDDNRSYVYDNSTNTWTQIQIGQIIYDQSTNTNYTFYGDYWVGDDNRHYQYDNSTNTWVEVHIGQVIYDSSTNTHYTYKGDYWVGDDNRAYTYNYTTNTWVDIDIVVLCDTTSSATDTFYQILTVIDTIIQTDTLTHLDTVLLVVPEDFVPIRIGKLPSELFRRYGCGETGLTTLTGGIDSLNFVHRWGEHSTLFGTIAKTNAGYTSYSRVVDDSVSFTLTPVDNKTLDQALGTCPSANNGPLMTGKFDCDYQVTSPYLEWAFDPRLRFGTYTTGADDVFLYGAITPGIQAEPGVGPLPTLGWVLVDASTVVRDYSVERTDPGAYVPASTLAQ